MTVVFAQVNKRAAAAKMKRMGFGGAYGTIGFANVMLKCDNKNEPIPFQEWYIELESSYHAESTLERMYKTNGKKWD